MLVIIFILHSSYNYSTFHIIVCKSHVRYESNLSSTIFSSFNTSERKGLIKLPTLSSSKLNFMIADCTSKSAEDIDGFFLREDAVKEVASIQFIPAHSLSFFIIITLAPSAAMHAIGTPTALRKMDSTCLASRKDLAFVAVLRM